MERKKIILNLSAMDNSGAGNFALEFNKILNEVGYDAFLLVKESQNLGKLDKNVFEYPRIRFERVISKIYRRYLKRKWTTIPLDPDYYFYNNFERISVVSAQRILSLIPQKPDIIFIHWVTDFITAKIISDLHKLLPETKFYWLMLDNAPITGGCHYAWDCQEYQRTCSNCPAIIPEDKKIIAQKNLAYKLHFIPQDLCLITVSEGDYWRAKESSLFKNKRIVKLLEVVDETKFKPSDKTLAKAYFGVSEKVKIIFFGATALEEKRKGMMLLFDVIQEIKHEEVLFLVAGEGNDNFASKNVKMLGKLNEETLIKAYQAAHIFVCPSLEDTGPIMLSQAIMCGTPAIAFDIGVAKDLIITGKTGYKAQTRNRDDLLKGINYMLNLDDNSYKAMAENCRETAMKCFGKEVFKAQIHDLISANDEP